MDLDLVKTDLEVYSLEFGNCRPKFGINSHQISEDL